MLKRYFDFQGRIGRRAYFLNYLVGTLGMAAVVGVSAALFGVIYKHIPSFLGFTIAVVGLLAMTAVMCVFSFSQAAKRGHDLGHPTPACLLMMVPLVSALYWLYLSFAAGQLGDNEFGSPDNG